MYHMYRYTHIRHVHISYLGISTHPQCSLKGKSAYHPSSWIPVSWPGVSMDRTMPMVSKVSAFSFLKYFNIPMLVGFYPD